MKYKLSAPVKGTALLERPITFEKDGLEYHFAKDENNQLATVSVTLQVERGTVKSTFEPTPAGASTKSKGTFTIAGNEEAQTKTLGALQRLESHLSFSTMGNVSAIAWDQAELELIPESDAEREDLVILKFSYKKGYPETTVLLDPQLLQSAAGAVATHEETYIPKAFWREAHRDFLSQRYIQAFNGFYFVIEFCFAEGKSSKKQVVDRFSSAPILSEAIDFMLARVRSDERHLRDLQRLYAQERQTLDVPGTCSFLFGMRGRLHHARRGSRKQPVSFEHLAFESLAWFAMGIATDVITKLDLQVGPLYAAYPLPVLRRGG